MSQFGPAVGQSKKKAQGTQFQPTRTIAKPTTGARAQQLGASQRRTSSAQRRPRTKIHVEDKRQFAVVLPNTGKQVIRKTAARPYEVAVSAAYREVPNPITVVDEDTRQIYQYENVGWRDYRPKKPFIPPGQTQPIQFGQRPVLRSLVQGEQVGKGKPTECIYYPQKQYPARSGKGIAPAPIKTQQQYRLQKGFANPDTGAELLADALAAKRRSSGTQKRRKSSGTQRKRKSSKTQAR